MAYIYVSFCSLTAQRGRHGKYLRAEKGYRISMPEVEGEKKSYQDAGKKKKMKQLVLLKTSFNGRYLLL